MRAPIIAAMPDKKKPTAGPTTPIAVTDVRGEIATPVRVLRQFRLVFNAVKTHFQQVEKTAGIGGAQVWGLSVIRDHPGMGVKQLARALDVRQPTASNIVRALCKQGLVEVLKDDRDGRAVRLQVRPEGLAVLQRAPGPFAGVLPEALASLDPATLANLERDLAVLIQSLDVDKRGANVPLSQI